MSTESSVSRLAPQANNPESTLVPLEPEVLAAHVRKAMQAMGLLASELDYAVDELRIHDPKWSSSEATKAFADGMLALSRLDQAIAKAVKGVA